MFFLSLNSNEVNEKRLKLEHEKRLKLEQL